MKHSSLQLQEVLLLFLISPLQKYLYPLWLNDLVGT